MEKLTASNVRVGQLVAYCGGNGTHIEIGKVKEVRETGAFVNYHSGPSAAFTEYDMLMPILNEEFINKTDLG